MCGTLRKRQGETDGERKSISLSVYLDPIYPSSFLVKKRLAICIFCPLREREILAILCLSILAIDSFRSLSICLILPFNISIYLYIMSISFISLYLSFCPLTFSLSIYPYTYINKSSLLSLLFCLSISI
jgi:hypothetical protein